MSRGRRRAWIVSLGIINSGAKIGDGTPSVAVSEAPAKTAGEVVFDAESVVLHILSEEADITACTQIGAGTGVVLRAGACGKGCGAVCRREQGGRQKKKRG